MSSSVMDCSSKRHPRTSDFSIEHILYVAGENRRDETNAPFAGHLKNKGFEWLNCTRYKPPKLPRHRKKESLHRRKLGRNPRIPFSTSQVAVLEAKFLQSPYLSSTDVTKLASYLKLSETKVKIWFQNRRAREKREKSREEKTEGEPQPELKELTPAPIVYSTTFLGFLDPGRYVHQVMSPLDLRQRTVGPCDPLTQ